MPGVYARDMTAVLQRRLDRVSLDGESLIVEVWHTRAGPRTFRFWPSWGRGRAGRDVWGDLVLRDGGYALKLEDGTILDPRTT